MKRHLTVKEASKILGLSTNTIYKYLNDGLLFGKRVGRGRFKIPRSEIYPFIKASESEKENVIDDEDVKDRSNFFHKSYIIIFSSLACLVCTLILIGTLRTFDLAKDNLYQINSRLVNINQTEGHERTLGHASERIKTITFIPDYPNAKVSSFFGMGTDTEVSGLLSLVTEKEEVERTFYEWVSEKKTLNYLTIMVPISLPENFYDWVEDDSLTIDISTDSQRYDENVIDIILRLKDRERVASVFSQTSVRSGEWRKISFNGSDFSDGNLLDWNKKGQEMILFLRLGTKEERAVRVGDIKLTYKERI